MLIGRYIDSFNQQKQITFYFIVIIVFSILIYGIYFNSLKNNFVNWDEPGLILNNKKIRSLKWQNVKEMFLPKKASTYQPIRMLSYAFDYHFWKLNPMGYRITNIIFYLLTCIMVFLILQILSSHIRDRASPESHFRVALFGSLLFATHPVHVEAVTWLAARKEVLQGFFFFSAFYLYLKGRKLEGRKKILHFALILLFILFATLSKPSAVVFPAVILVYEIAQNKNGWVELIKRNWLFFLAFLVISIIFTTILIKVMLDSGGVKPYYGDTFLKNFLVCIYVFLRSIKLLIFQINFSAAYSFPIQLPVFRIKNIIFIILPFTILGFGIWSLKRWKVFFFSIFFFLVTLLPYLNIIPISTLLADRYVFIASFAYCFLMAVFFDKLYGYENKKFSKGFFNILSGALFLFILTGYSYMTIYQNTIWQNSYTLWADAVEKHPNSNTANALMGVVYMEIGMDQEALKYLEKAVQILPYDYQSRNNLGIVYGRLGQPEKALKELLLAMYLAPNDESIKINLSLLYLRQKEFKKAEEILKNLIEKNPQDAQLHYRLSYVYKEMGSYEKAIEELQMASRLAPHIINPYEEIGNIYSTRLKDTEKAVYYYSKGIEMVSKAKERVEDLRWMVQDLKR